MEEILIKAERRNVLGKQVRALRRQGKLPGVLYGRSFEPTPILMDTRDTTRTLAKAASSAILTVELEGEKHLALLREKQRDFIRGTLKHLDLQVVSMTEKLRTSVAVAVTGESRAIKDYNGILVVNINEIEVECFPQDLPERIVADISKITAIGGSIKVRDLALSDKVTVLEHLDEIVVIITAPAVEEAAPVAAAAEGAVVAAEGAEPEVIEKGKKEEEEF
jgi:large subunit ribosomal protein L25